MGLRFRQTFRLAPGIKVNLGKKSGSLSFGGKGFTVNVGQQGARTTVGLPGSGVSYQTRPMQGRWGWLVVGLLILAALAVAVL